MTCLTIGRAARTFGNCGSKKRRLRNYNKPRSRTRNVLKFQLVSYSKLRIGPLLYKIIGFTVFSYRGKFNRHYLYTHLAAGT